MRMGFAAAAALVLAGCEVDGVLLLQLLDGTARVQVQVFDDAECNDPFQSKTGAMFGAPVLIEGPIQDGGRVGLSVAPAAHNKVVRIELEAYDDNGSIERWCACPRLPGSGEVSVPIPVRAARGTPDECQAINLDDVRFAQQEVGEACSFDFECKSHHCECQTPDCSELACAEQQCECGFYDGQEECVVRTAEGDEPIHDPEDCEGEAECVGFACLLATGAAGCGWDSQCASGHCACADVECSATVCSEIECEVCHWYDGADCLGLVSTGTTAPNCLGTCSTTGCRLEEKRDEGEVCYQDSDCADGLRCWCANPACGVKQCTTNVVACTYDDGTRIGHLFAGVDDPDNSCGFGSSCAADGACGADPGSTCTADNECAHGYCECTTGSCGATRCNQVACPCQYDTDNSDYGCEGYLTRFVDDARDSCGPELTCAGDGGCHLADGETCRVPERCESGQCADSRCCDSACTGTCDRCDMDGQLGVCVLDDSLCIGSCDRCGAGGVCEPVASECRGACGVCLAEGDYFNCGADETQCSPPGPTCARCETTDNGTTWACAFDPEADAECSAAHPEGYECTGINVCSGPDGATCINDDDCVAGRCGGLGTCCAADSPCAGGVSAGASHTCAVLRPDLVRCWGEGDYGAVGDADTTPHQVESPSAVAVAGTRVACGDGFNCAQVADNLGCWGRGDSGQLGIDASSAGVGSIVVPDDLVCLASGSCPPDDPLANVTSVATGQHHACAVVDLGGAEARCWGDNDHGQLGASTTGDQLAPVVVCDSPACSGALTGVTAVAAGRRFSCGVVGAYVRCWGDNYYGQLGDGTRAGSLPVEVKRRDLDISLTHAASIAAGARHACAVDNDGSVWCWGSNAFGQVGVDTGTCTGGGEDGEPCAGEGDCPGGSCDAWVTQAVPVSLSDGAIMVAAGGNHTCAIIDADTGNEIWCWGENADGQLGDGRQCGDACVSPVRLEASFRPVAVDAGERHTCAVDDHGEVWCWGRNDHDQLGIPQASAIEDEPRRVTHWP